MNTSKIINTTTATITTAQRNVLNSARTLLIKDGLMLDRPLDGKVTEKSDLLNYSITAECGGDIVIVNLPLTKGVPNTSRVAVHSEMHGELVAMRTIAKSLFRGTTALTSLYINVEKAYTQHLEKLNYLAELKLAQQEIDELEAELNSNVHSDAIDRALKLAIKSAKRNSY